MKYKIILCIILVSIGLASLGYANVKDKKYMPTLTIQTQDNLSYKFKIEVADTPAERSYGLMNRTDLKPNAGMLFVFEDVSFQEFWMKDTLIPLDILFIDAHGKITHIVENAKPNDLTPLPSGGPVKAALEILGGQSGKLGIKKGDLVKYNLFTNGK